MGRHTRLYDVLGLTSDCSDQEIRKAYKKLALKYHPDKNRDDRENAERMFKAVSEAYNVLRDADQRRVYDRYGEDGLNGNMGGTSSGGTHFQHVDPQDLFAQFFGPNFMADFMGAHHDPFQHMHQHNHMHQHQQMHQQNDLFGHGSMMSGFHDPFFQPQSFGGFSSFDSFGGAGFGGGGAGFGGGGMASFSKSQSSFRDANGRVVTKITEVRNGVRTETEQINGQVVAQSIDGVPQDIGAIEM